MPFRVIVEDLVSSTEGAVGAVFLDESGEIVHQADAGQAKQDLRLIAAWVGIYIRQMDRMIASDDLGSLRLFHAQNDRSHLFACPLDDGYSLVLLQRSPHLSAFAKRALLDAGAKIVSEVLR